MRQQGFLLCSCLERGSRGEVCGVDRGVEPGVLRNQENKIIFAEMSANFDEKGGVVLHQVHGTREWAPKPYIFIKCPQKSRGGLGLVGLFLGRRTR